MVGELDFKAVKVTPYLSVVEGRKPRQKTHTKLAHAKSAFDTRKYNSDVPYKYKYGSATTHAWGAIYEFSGSDWVLLYEIPKPTEADEIPSKYVPKYETRPWRLDKEREQS